MRKADRWSSIVRTELDVFLPAGYPNSVTEDYLPYVSLITSLTPWHCADPLFTLSPDTSSMYASDLNTYHSILICS